MQTLIISRFHSDDKNTLSAVNLLDKNEKVIFSCCGLELPSKQNQKRISSIPLGVYRGAVWQSPKFGKVILIKDVPNRDNILIHVGNYSGDTLGCILVGEAFSYSVRFEENVLINSRIALNKLLSKIDASILIQIS